MKRPEGVLQNIITHLCFKTNPLSSIKLMKMVYLVDVYHYRLFNRRATNIPFIHYFYGVYSSKIEETLNELYEKEILKEKVVTTQKQYKAVIPTPQIQKTFVSLPKTILEALDEVIEDWGKASSDEIVKFTKETLPFLNTSFGEEIDFSRIDPVVEYAKEQGISEEEAATEDIISDKPLLSQIKEAERDLREGKMLTHNQLFGK